VTPERTRSRPFGGVGARIALVALITSGLAVAIVAAGVLLVGGDTFARLMEQHGGSTSEAHAMFDESVTIVLIMGLVAGVMAATVLAIVLGRRLARPLDRMDDAARRIAAGDYAARVPGGGPTEIASLADSFNSMAASLQAQELLRRTFVANASHELRTPLTNLRGYLEALRDGVIPAEPAVFDSLSEEVDRLTRLARSLDTLAADDTAREDGLPAAWSAEALDVAIAIRGAVVLAGPGFERAGIRVDVDAPDGLTARVDPDAFAQILGNLLQNAARYAPAGGSSAVRAESAPDGGASEVLVSVTSSGPPIPPEDLPHLFDRFYRVEKSRDRSRGGAGIGLAIVRDLVEAAGGQVGVEATPAGNRFWFTLPA
jgi:two-component system sensor histidine kinase BaeS